MLNNIKKIIAVDLDGTLLNNNRKVSIQTVLYLRKLNRLGYLVVLASGRPWRSIKSVYKLCGCKGPVISYNGSYVFHPYDKDYKVFKATFDKKQIIEIYNKTAQVTTSFMCESLDTVFINKKDKYLKHYFWYKGMKLKEGPISNILNENPLTCLILRPSSDDEIVDNACANISPVHLRHWTNSNYAELYLDGVDKGSALEYVMKSLNVSKKDVIAFGDADNDFSMLQTAGQGFAMANSRSIELTKSFQKTEFDNHHNGITKELKKILKI